jgi:hypothetical protein
MDRFRSGLGLIALLCFSIGWWPTFVSAQSQTTSSVRGSVVEANGDGVADALVTIRHAQTGAERSVLTDQAGKFVLLLLQPGGPYTVTASRIGFSPAVEEGIQLQVGERHEVRLVLEESPIEVEGISVSVERSEIFNPSQIGLATLLNEVTIRSVPLPSRNILDLTILSPMVRTTESGGFSIAGQNDRYNSILVDGLLNKDAFGLTSGGVPGGQAGAKLLPLEAIAQYEILVAPYDAGLSGFAGGVMNAVTKTGTNEWRFNTFAVGRNDALMGDLTLPSGTAEASGIQRAILGGSAGGPIIQDRAHFFLAGELEKSSQPPTGYNLGRDPRELIGILPEAVDAFQDFFEADHGVETGEAGVYGLNRTLGNLFARVDWNFIGGNRLTARNNFAYARNDESPNRAPFEPYGFSSNGILRASASNTTSLQFFSEFGNNGGNEIALTVQRTRDQTDPVEAWPQVEVVLESPAQSVTATRPIRAGAEFFAQENDLTQTTIRLANTVTLARGRNTWTMGLVGTWHGIRQAYLPGSLGEWQFPSWIDVVNNAPQRYQRTVLQEGEDPQITFAVAEAGAFLQDQIEVGRGLTLRIGLRVDAPFTLDHPEANPRVLSFFDRSTSEVPSGMVLFSPRFGFNWQGGDELRTQIRGGVGLFTGQLPHVWLSNAFHNPGTRSVTNVCYGRRTSDPLEGNTSPPFNPATPPESCLFGVPTEVRVVTMFEDGFVYPQYAKLSAAVDQEITSAISATVSAIFTHSINQVLLRELNIRPQEEALLSLRGYGGTSRTRFGIPSEDGFYPIRLLPGYDQVLLATNGSGDRSWSVSGELNGDITENLSFQAGYAYARSYDRMSLASVDLISNFGFTPTHGDPNDPPLTPSNFDRPHKVVLALFGTPIPRLENTEIALLYTGVSGLPFSYVYRGDINGDGYPGLGPASDRNNDLLYVPESAIGLPSSIGTHLRLAAALETDECLKKFRGTYITRNGCRAPWQNRLDLRLAHTSWFGGAEVRFEGDVINFLNLLNSDWGLVKTIPPVSSLLEPSGRVEVVGELLSYWAAGLLPFRDSNGELVTPEPWSVASPESQWQAQFGLRVSW